MFCCQPSIHDAITLEPLFDESLGEGKNGCSSRDSREWSGAAGHVHMAVFQRLSRVLPMLLQDQQYKHKTRSKRTEQHHTDTDLVEAGRNHHECGRELVSSRCSAGRSVVTLQHILILRWSFGEIVVLQQQFVPCRGNERGKIQREKTTPSQTSLMMVESWQGSAMSKPLLIKVFGRLSLQAGPLPITA